MTPNEVVEKLLKESGKPVFGGHDPSPSYWTRSCLFPVRLTRQKASLDTILFVSWHLLEKYKRAKNFVERGLENRETGPRVACNERGCPTV